MTFLMSDQSVACPYCYHSIDATRVMFRCSGRPAPGKDACVVAEDEIRINTLKDNTAVLPSFTGPRSRRPYWIGALFGADVKEISVSRYGVGEVRRAICPDCLGETGTRVCPVCRSVLPAHFDRGSPMIGMVGVKGSGKTVMLTVLVSELLGPVARRLDASITTVGTSALLDKMRGWLENMQHGGALPPPTPEYAPKETVPIVLEWRQRAKGFLGRSHDTSTILSFYDTAGEDLKTTDLTRDQHYLAAADGLIVVLDPFQFRANRIRGAQRGMDPKLLNLEPVDVLTSITEMLREADQVRSNKRISRPIALVVTKIDAFFDGELGADDPTRRPSATAAHFDEDESRNLHLHVEGLINEWGGEDVLRHLRFNYSNYRFFAASALGAEPTSYGGGKQGVDEQGLRPHRVAEPLLWLMAGRGLIDVEG
jgi:hypothetical protein